MRSGPNWPIPSDLKWEDIDGYPRAYRAAGEGTPIVLVHGSTNERPIRKQTLRLAAPVSQRAGVLFLPPQV
jgi:hypothetical protein